MSWQVSEPILLQQRPCPLNEASPSSQVFQWQQELALQPSSFWIIFDPSQKSSPELELLTSVLLYTFPPLQYSTLLQSQANAQFATAWGSWLECSTATHRRPWESIVLGSLHFVLHAPAVPTIWKPPPPKIGLSVRSPGYWVLLVKHWDSPNSS